MEGIITSKSYEVHSYEVDHYYNVLPEIILSYMQDIAMLQSELLGVGRNFLEQKNISWIVTRYYVKIEDYPKYMDKIKVSTKAVGFNKLFAFRDFIIDEKCGKKLISANSQWMLIDSKNHKMRKIDDNFYNAYGVDKQRKVVNPFGKSVLPVNINFKNEITAAYSDIDFNGHVNNRRYISWAINSIPKEILKQYILSEFDISFKKEILIDQCITVYTEIIKQDSCVVGNHKMINDNDELVCCVNTKWIK